MVPTKMSAFSVSVKDDDAAPAAPPIPGDAEPPRSPFLESLTVGVRRSHFVWRGSLL